LFVSQECKSCLILRGKLAQAEALLEEKSSVSSFTPLNEAMAEDLQKLRERVREVSDQESALKRKLRAVDDDYLALTRVSYLFHLRRKKKKLFVRGCFILEFMRRSIL
jgi:hypothetical protein